MGSGDLFSFAEKYNWQFLGFGLLRDGESNIHGREENIRLDDFIKAVKIFELFFTQPRH